MNQLNIIGNLTRDPESRDYDGALCCTFTVAVNRRVRAGAHPQADYVRVTAWRGLGEICEKYLEKGKKVRVTGPVRAHAYTGQDGEARASLEMTADDVEFLTSKGASQAQNEGQDEGPDDFTEVDDDELPF